MLTLQKPPKDIITDIKVQDNKIYISSFENTIKMYEECILTQELTHSLPVLRLTFLNQEIIFSDIKGNVITPNNTIKTDCGGVQGLKTHNKCIIAAGWNKKLIFIENERIVHTVKLNKKVYDMDINNNLILLGCNEQKYALLDIRKTNKIAEKQVKSFFCSVALGDAAVIGTIDGRMKIDSTFSDKKIEGYRFNCYNRTNNNVRVNYPINTLLLDQTLISAGSDGQIFESDLVNKKIIKKIYSSEYPISCLGRFGNKLVGFSDNYEKGDENIFKPVIKIIDK